MTDTRSGREAQACFSVVALLISACGGVDWGAPLLSGQADFYGDDHREIEQRVLTPGELRELTHWMEQHRGGWGPIITEPVALPTGPYFNVRVERTDGETASLLVVGGGGHYRATLDIGPGVRWAYTSSAGILKTRQAVRAISDDDVASLRKLLRNDQGPQCSAQWRRDASPRLEHR